MFQLRRSAIRILSLPSSRAPLQSRSISILSRLPQHAARPAITVQQRRWASEEAIAEKIEKVEPNPQEELENAVTSDEAGLTGDSAQEAAAPSARQPSAAAVDQRSNTAIENKPISTVYIGNLYFDVNETDIQSELSRFGNVERVNIVRDGRGLSKGFGYVAFDSVEAATKAVNEMHLTVYEGRRISVQFASRPMNMKSAYGSTVNPPSKTLFIGNMSYDMTDADLNSLFKGIKNVIDVRVAIDRRTGQPRGFAHADFLDVQSAQDAHKILADKITYGRRLRVDYSVNNPSRRDNLGSVEDAPTS